jgi:hypothetical protein
MDFLRILYFLGIFLSFSILSILLMIIIKVFINKLLKKDKKISISDKKIFLNIFYNICFLLLFGIFYMLYFRKYSSSFSWIIICGISIAFGVCISNLTGIINVIISIKNIALIFLFHLMINIFTILIYILIIIGIHKIIDKRIEIKYLDNIFFVIMILIENIISYVIFKKINKIALKNKIRNNCA